jgi:hypothetical protein
MPKGYVRKQSKATLLDIVGYQPHVLNREGAKGNSNDNVKRPTFANGWQM